MDYVSGSGGEEKWKLEEKLVEVIYGLDIKGERKKELRIIFRVFN